jgi:hypothetical protein
MTPKAASTPHASRKAATNSPTVVVVAALVVAGLGCSFM